MFPLLTVRNRMKQEINAVIRVCAHYKTMNDNNMVSTGIIVNRFEKLLWETSISTQTADGISLDVLPHELIEVTFPAGISFQLSRTGLPEANYLGFYITNVKGLSSAVEGVLGKSLWCTCEFSFNVSYLVSL